MACNLWLALSSGTNVVLGICVLAFFIQDIRSHRRSMSAICGDGDKS